MSWWRRFAVPLDIRAEYARITGGRWIDDPDDVEAILDWIYETESLLTLIAPQSDEEAENIFDGR